MAGIDVLSTCYRRGQVRAKAGKLFLDAAQESGQACRAGGRRGFLQQSPREPDARGKLVHRAQTFQPLGMLGQAPPAGKLRLPAITFARVDSGQTSHLGGEVGLRLVWVS